MQIPNAAAMRAAASSGTHAAPSLARAVDGVAGGATIDLAGRTIGHVLDDAGAHVDALLPEFLQRQRWFGGKGAPLESVRIGDVVPIPGRAPGSTSSHLAMVDVAYADGSAPERYATALAAIPVDSPRLQVDGVAPLATVHAREGEFVLADAFTDREVVEGFVDAMRGNHELAGSGARLDGLGGPVLDQAADSLGHVQVEPLSLLSSNTSVRVAGDDGRAFALKLVRRHDGVLDPDTPTRALDVWKGAYLTNEAGYRNTPGVLGSIEHVGSERLPRTISVLTEFVPNEGDGWAHALDEVTRTLSLAHGGATPVELQRSIDAYGRAARQHGRRIGEMHVALSSGGPASEFRGVIPDVDATAAQARKVAESARRAVDQLRATGRSAQADLIERSLPGRLEEIGESTGQLVPIEDIHTHGDFHLGQVLKTGDDIQIIDLEGAPALPVAERWKRVQALGDVARQRSSYEYAASQAIRDATRDAPEAVEALRPVADEWAATAQREFLDGWLDATSDRRFRHARTELGPELQAAELDNAFYETVYEARNRPDWLDIPLGRVERLLGSPAVRT